MKKNIVLLFLSIIILFAFPAWSKSTPEEEAEETEMAAEEPKMEEAKYKEAPMLAEMVAKGELPPLEERLPKTPKVVEMTESIGRHGGELVVFATKYGNFNEDLQGMWGNSILKVPRNGQWIEPDLAEGWEIDDARMSITVFLREGAKWSDGHHITSEDIRFTYEDMHFNPNVGTWGALGGAITSVDVIDELAIKLNTTSGIGVVPYSLSDWFGGYATTLHPAHYLKKWHIDYNPDAEKLAKEEGKDFWYEAMRFHYWWAPLEDVDKPQFEPWDLTQISQAAKLLVRNPYYYRVDPEGNQLPYIDKVNIQIVSPEIYQLKVSGGDADIAYKNTKLENLSLYMTSKEAGDYQVILFPGAMGSNVKIIFTGIWNRDPVIAEIIGNLSFRRALSVAINRDEINQVIYNGLGVPRKTAPLASVSFYKDGWAEDWAQYDPALANKLLDEAGLDKRDRNGFRLQSDGKVFTFIIDYSKAEFTAELELIKEYFEDVGIKTIIKLGDASLIEERRIAREQMANIHTEPNQPWCFERNMYVNTWVWGGPSREWNMWEDDHRVALESLLKEGESLPENWRSQKSGLDGTDAYRNEDLEPPERMKEIMTLEDVWNSKEEGSPEYKQLGQELFEYWVEEAFWRVGTVGQVPAVLIAKNGLGNVFTPEIISGFPLDHLLAQTFMDQLYWKE